MSEECHFEDEVSKIQREADYREAVRACQDDNYSDAVVQYGLPPLAKLLGAPGGTPTAPFDREHTANPDYISVLWAERLRTDEILSRLIRGADAANL